MDDGYSRLILLAGVVLFFLAAGVAIWRFIKSRQENVTEEDIMDMVNEGHEQGVLESSEAEMITNIFEFDDKEAGDIMTHRKNIVALDGSMSLREAAHFVLKEAKNSRYPVYGKDLDDIIGTVHMRDVLFHAENLQESRMEIANVPGVLRPAHFIPETRNINSLFKEMQSQKIHMEIVIDEYGQTAGIVTMEDILEEARALAEDGVQECIVIAQDITRYGVDLYGERRLPELLRELCRLPFHWVRLHYLYPDNLSDQLIDTIAGEEKICNYLDIPIQHCNDTVLKAMRRRETKAGLEELFRRVRERIPGVVLRTSLITGLPYEDEAAFEELCDFLGEQKLQRVGAFPYSPEEGTPAAKMLNRVDTEEAQRRAELVMEIQTQVMDEFNDSRMGDTVEVLCDGYDVQAMSYVGRSYAESPGIDGCIFFTAERDVEPGDFVMVRITGAMDGDLTGEAVEELSEEE